MPTTIAVINAYPRFDAVFDPVALEMRMAVRKYPGIRLMADDLNAKSLPAEDLALIILTGTAETNDPAQYKKNMSLLGQLAKHSKLGSVPVLFLGYRGDASLSEACEGCGASYLALPVRKGALIERIKALTPRPPLPKGEGEFGKKSPGREPLSLRERGAAEPGVREDKIKTESERRLATVMFADISGFTAMSEKMDPEEVTSVMNGVFHKMEEVIDSHGGHIDKFIGDCVMVCFGVPKALENAPLRAVNTAIEMRNALYRFNRERKLNIPLDIHIGMNTGPVVAGQVGGKGRKDYTVMGDAVNLASRIEGASEKGQILVGPDTFRATQSDFEYRDLPPVSLKGKAEPVPVYEVLSTKEASSRRARPGARVAPRKKKGTAAGPDRMIFSEMVGRDEEMNELRHAVTGLVRGKGGIVSVIGEAGIGKSRLMAELKSDPAMKQVTLLEGQALSMGRTLSFHPIIDMLKNWAGISEEDQEGAQLAKLDRAVRAVHPDEADEIVPFVGTMMGMKLTGQFAERVKGIEGEGLEKLIFKNVRALLIRGAELRPMIIRVEDLHWADTSSIELLISLFRLARDHRIMFLNFFRPNYPDTGDRVAKACREEYSCALTPASGAPLSRGERGSVGENLSQGLPSPSGRGAGGEGGISSSIYTEILVQPLDGKESATLISNLLNIRGLPQSLRDQITDRAGGNPFFIEEVVRSLIDEGAVVRKGDSFAVTDRIHEVKVPLTINEVLMSRIDRLDEETRSLIRTASVIGRYFFYKIIAQVAQNISDIDRRLSYLEDIQLIRERKRMDELEYLFKHALAQEAAYDSILIQKRKELHLHVAQAIESVFAGRLHEFYGMLAYHYSRGEDVNKSEEYMLKAGEEAMKSAATSEALEYFKRSLSLYKEKYGDKIDRAKIAMMEKNIAIAHYNRGEYVLSQEYLDRVLPFYGISLPGNRFSEFYRFLQGMFHFIVGLYIPSIKWKKKPSPEFSEAIVLYHLKTSSLFNIDPKKWFIGAFYPMKSFTGIDLSRMPNGAGLFSGYSIMFSISGISFTISRRILDFLAGKVNPEEKKSVLYYNAYAMIHSICAGDRFENYQYDDDLFRWNIKNGEFYLPAIYVGAFALKAINRGNRDEAIQFINILKEIHDVYENQISYGMYFEYFMRMLVKFNMWEKAIAISKSGIVFTMQKGIGLIRLALHSYRARAEAMMGNEEDAEIDFKEAETIMASMKTSPCYQIPYQMGSFIMALRRMERMIEGGGREVFSNVLQHAKKSEKKAVATTLKYFIDRTEALRLAGTRRWLLGTAAFEGLLGFGTFLAGFRALRHYRAAIRWWKKSIDIGEKLGAKLELSRTYAEVGKRLGGRYLHVDADPNGGIPQRHARLPRALVRAHVYAEKRLGLSPEECLEKAEAMFREMDLQWDLAELAKVREKMS